MVCPFLDQEFGDKDIPAQPRDSVREFPDRPWVEMSVLFWDFLEDVVDERLVDFSDVGVVRAPCIDGEAVLASEKFFEESHVRCLRRDVYHALKPDIFI